MFYDTPEIIVYAHAVQSVGQHPLESGFRLSVSGVTLQESRKECGRVSGFGGFSIEAYGPCGFATTHASEAIRRNDSQNGAAIPRGAKSLDP